MLRIVFIALVFLLYVLPVAAMPVPGLFEAEVPVESQDREQRTEALKQAFGEVLVRVTGDGGIAGHPEAESLLRMAPQFVQRFRYDPAPEGEAGFRLHVVFDEKRLVRALADRGLPVWGRDRPAVLAWVAVVDGGRRKLIGERSDDPALEILKDEARRRGIPLLFPLLDLQDRRLVRVADILGGFEEPVREASRRYAGEALLIGRVMRRGGTWLARWQLEEGDQSVRFESDGGSLEEVLRLGVGGTASWLANWHARSAFPGDEAGLRLVVEEVHRFADLVRLRRYLEGLDGMESVRPVRVAPPVVELELRLRGGERDLRRMLSLDTLLEAVPGEGGTAALRYRLLP